MRTETLTCDYCGASIDYCGGKAFLFEVDVYSNPMFVLISSMDYVPREIQEDRRVRKYVRNGAVNYYGHGRRSDICDNCAIIAAKSAIKKISEENVE